MHEVVLHGYFHSRPRSAGGWWDTFVTEHYTAREGEFYDLSESEATLRLERGKQRVCGTWLSGARVHCARLASWSRSRARS